MKFHIQHFRYSGFVAIAYTDRGPKVLYKLDGCETEAWISDLLPPKSGLS